MRRVQRSMRGHGNNTILLRSRHVALGSEKSYAVLMSSKCAFFFFFYYYDVVTRLFRQRFRLFPVTIRVLSAAGHSNIFFLKLNSKTYSTYSRSLAHRQLLRHSGTEIDVEQLFIKKKKKNHTYICILEHI